VDRGARHIAGNVYVQSLKDNWNNSLKELRILHRVRRCERLPDSCRNGKDWQSARTDYYLVDS
jgi:hypothetical protein